MKKHISKKILREFGLLLAIGFPLLIGALIPLLTGHGFIIWTFWVAIPSLLLSLLAPGALYYPYKIWMALGLLLGFINSHIILGIVFLLVLLPIAFVMRISGYDPLRRHNNLNLSYRETKENSEIDLTRIF